MASASSNDYEQKKKSMNNGIRSGFLGKTGSDEMPIDKTLYNILNVLPTASSTEIKRAYYALSLQYHPDRTQNLDEFTRREYAERFKHISQAYSILSDPEKRTLYNRYGKDERLIANGAAGISLEDFDAEEFFRFMFGGEEFIDIIGDFELAKSFKYAVGELINDTGRTHEQQNKHLAFEEERKKLHEKRINQLSTNLISKLSIFTDVFLNDDDKIEDGHVLNRFTEIIRSDIPNLLQAPHGEHLLHCIGYVYSTKARFWLSKLDSQKGPIGKRLLAFGRHVKSTWKDRAHIVKEAVKTVKCAVELEQSMSKLVEIEDDTSNDTKNGNFSQSPFSHHSGHLEYSGFTPSESTASSSLSSSSYSNTTATSSMKSKQKYKPLTQPIAPLTDVEKRQLETDTAAKSIEILWLATKLEIESIERDVCDHVLNDLSCSRDIRRRRCIALAKIGELWQQT